MKFIVKNLGILKCAEIEIGDLTIVCGKNNTGKTYATYLIWGFLSYFWEAYEYVLEDNIINILISSGNVKFPIGSDKAHTTILMQSIIDIACKKYIEHIHRVFASSSELYSNTVLNIILDDSDIKPMDKDESIVGSQKNNFISITKSIDDDFIDLSLLVDKHAIKIHRSIINRTIGYGIKKILFYSALPEPTLICAERTGIEIFQAELDLARNRLLDTLKDNEGKFDPFDIIRRVNTDYSMPISRNVDRVREYKGKVKQTSFIANEYPYILKLLYDIMGGDVSFIRNIMYFTPTSNKKLRLKINECSSSVRSLIDLGLYIKHVAKGGDILMIDEPELSLHPENQRKLVRLLIYLINVGIKVYFTTHSDYMVKELNNILIMSRLSPQSREKIFRKYKYSMYDILLGTKTRVYVASSRPILLEGMVRKTRCNTFIQAEDNGYGFELDSFDRSIDEMNDIQDDILYEV